MTWGCAEATPGPTPDLRQSYTGVTQCDRESRILGKTLLNLADSNVPLLLPFTVPHDDLKSPECSRSFGRVSKDRARSGDGVAQRDGDGGGEQAYGGGHDL